MAMEVLISDSPTETLFTERHSLIKFDESRIREVIAEGSLDFDGWASLISDIEKLFPGDIDKISLVYDSFLAEYPLCFAYWRKYAHHKTRLCAVDKAVEVFERAVQSATYSVDVWLDYCSFSISVFEDPSDIRRLFKRGISLVGKDYMCHTLWDKYIAFEFSQQQWSSLAHIYIQTMRSPSRKLHHYHESFKKLATAWKEELEREGVSPIEFQLESIRGSEVPKNYKDGEISRFINDLLDPSLGLARSKALRKYLFHGERIYEEACQLYGKIHWFETRIRRRYFHVKPLDSSQLENWHDYLSFAEKHGDFEWVVKLYERCLIPCAHYPEFWMRYVDYLESKGAREIANLALARATQSFLKRVPVIHLLNARYKEQIGDIQMACASFLQCDTGSDSSFVESINMKANMEKRLGNFVAACNTYKEALESSAAKDKLHCLPILYVQFSRLKYMITESADAARDILVDGIKQVPCCKLLLEELIKFAMMHGGPRHIDIVDSVIANALYSAPAALQGFTEEDVEDISSLYLQFLDLCGTIHEVRKAWARHIKFFPNSMRTAYNHPTRVANPLKADMEIRQDKIAALPSHPSESDHLLQTPSKNKKLSPVGNDSYHSDQAVITVKSNQKSSLSKDDDAQFGNGKFDNPHLEDADDRVQERTQLLSHVVDEQRMEDVCEPSKSSFDLKNKDAKETVATETSDKLSKEEDTQHESGHESKHDLKPPSLERLSLDHQDKKLPAPVNATSHECEPREDTNFSQASSMSDRSMLVEGAQNNHMNHFVSSEMDTQASGSVQIQTGFVSPSSSASHPNIETDAPARLQIPANSGRSHHQRHNTNKNHRDSRLRSREHSHRRPHHRRRVSPQRYPQLGTGTQMPVTPGYPPPQPSSAQNPQMLQTQNQYPASASFTAPQVWPMQNIPHSNEQQNVIQNNEAYNHQMWQYYYYQQQQLYLQQQQLQPQQQQLLQQQYQQQQPYFQQQQHVLPQEQHQLSQEQQYQQMVQQHHLYHQQQQVPPQQEQQRLEEQQPELE